MERIQTLDTKPIARCFFQNLWSVFGKYLEEEQTYIMGLNTIWANICLFETWVKYE